MSSYQGFILFFLGLLLGLSIFGAVNFFAPKETTKKYLRCETERRETKIGLMIDEKNRVITLEGREINPEMIKTFSESLIYAEWKHSKGSTTVNLYRLTGILEIAEMGKSGKQDSMQQFTCAHVVQKF